MPILSPKALKTVALIDRVLSIFMMEDKHWTETKYNRDNQALYLCHMTKAQIDEHAEILKLAREDVITTDTAPKPKRFRTQELQMMINEGITAEGLMKLAPNGLLVVKHP